MLKKHWTMHSFVDISLILFFQTSKLIKQVKGWNIEPYLKVGTHLDTRNRLDNMYKNRQISNMPKYKTTCILKLAL
jgi:hypothetical protein